MRATSAVVLDITLENPRTEQALVSWWSEAKQHLEQQFQAKGTDLLTLERGHYKAILEFLLPGTWDLVQRDAAFQACESRRPASTISASEARVPGSSTSPARSLEGYRRQRMVILQPDTPVHEAACAMEENHIGLIIVQDRGSVVGVVTDRDLVMRVIARGLEPEQTRLSDVMTADPGTLPISADDEHALELMRDRHIRRVPLLEQGRAVGVITIDDLVLSGRVPLVALAAAVRAQLAEPADLKPAGATHPTRPVRSGEGPDTRGARHTARAAQTLHHTLARVLAATGLDDPERARSAIEIVVGCIVRRVMPPQAMHLLSQLPMELRESLADLPAGPDRSMTREVIEADLALRLDLDPPHTSELAHRIGIVLGELVTAGEIGKLMAALPEDLRSLLVSEPTAGRTAT